MPAFALVDIIQSLSSSDILPSSTALMALVGHNDTNNNMSCIPNDTDIHLNLRPTQLYVTITCPFADRLSKVLPYRRACGSLRPSGWRWWHWRCWVCHGPRAGRYLCNIIHGYSIFAQWNAH